MKFLKNPVVAVLLSLIIIIASSAISIDVKLSNRAGKVINRFYDGNGMKSIGVLLDELCRLSDDLAPLADNYGLDTDTAAAKSRELKQMISRRESDISAVYKVYNELSNSSQNILTSLESMSLSERHTQMVSTYSDEFAEIKNGIESSGYNVSVRKFLKSYGKFPARNFAELFSVTYPAYFN